MSEVMNAAFVRFLLGQIANRIDASRAMRAFRLGQYLDWNERPLAFCNLPSTPRSTCRFAAFPDRQKIRKQRLLQERFAGTPAKLSKLVLTSITLPSSVMTIPSIAASERVRRRDSVSALLFASMK